MAYRPFSNGSQYMDWKGSNCERCKKQYNEALGEVGDFYAKWPCPIEYAIDFASLDDGTIPDEIADRMGRADGRYNWPCGEVEWTDEWMAEWRTRQEAKSENAHAENVA